MREADWRQKRDSLLDKVGKTVIISNTFVNPALAGRLLSSRTRSEGVMISAQ